MNRRWYRSAGAALVVGSALAVALVPTTGIADDDPVNDDFAMATELVGARGGWRGTTEQAGAEPGEPVHADVGAGTSVWLVWQAPGDGTATFTADGSDGPVVTAAYTGKSVDALQAIAASVRSDAGGAPLRFSVAAGATYHVAVDGVAGAPAAGPVTIDLALFSPPNDNLDRARRLTGHVDTASTTTFAASREVGEPVHDGSVPEGGSVWFRWTAPATGTAMVAAAGTRAGQPALAAYRGDEVSDLAALDRSCGRSLCFRAQDGRTYRLALAPSGVDGAGAPVEDDLVVDLLLVAPGNDDLATSARLTGVSGDRSVTLRGSGQPGEPAHAGSAAVASRWYRWLPGAEGVARVRVDGAGRLAAYDPTGGDGGVDDLRSLDEAAGTRRTPARLLFPVSAGTPVLLAVDRPAGAAAHRAREVRLGYRVGPPSNDRRRDAQGLHVAGTRRGTTLGATAAGEPNLPGGDGRAVWYRLRGTHGDSLAVQTAGSAIDTILGVYEDTRAGLHLVAADDDGGPGRTSLARFRPKPDRRYLVAVEGKDGESGAVRVTVAPRSTPVVTVSSLRVAEGDEARFVIHASPAPQSRLRLAVATYDGSAEPGDYEPLDGHVALTADQPRAELTVPTSGDGTDEPGEAFGLVLSSSSRSVLLAGRKATAGIVDDDRAPRLGIEPGEATESAGPARHVLRLSEPSERPVAARLTTVADGTPLPAAPATVGEDYVSGSAHPVIRPGDTSARLDVALRDDLLDEPDEETMMVALTQPLNGRVDTATVLGGVVDDDPVPVLDVADIEVVEGASGAVRLLDIPVTLSAPTQNPVSFFYTTVSGTAVGPYDFRRTSGVLHIEPRADGTVANVLLRPDNLDEGDSEYFFVDISAANNATVGDASGRVLIIDDD